MQLNFQCLLYEKHNEKYCVAYIRGVAAGEGGIGKEKDKLRMVHIGGTKEEDKDFYSKCLKKLGITKLRIEICGLKNFIKLKNMDIFKYIPYRKRNFLKALKKLNKFNL